MEPQSQQPGLEFRLATPSDKAQVALCHGGEPGSVYDGLDYLPQRFEATLASWNKVCGLCFDPAAGLVVAYGQIFVFDNNRHMLLTALRVHRQYQGRGIARNLRNFLCQETKIKFPDVTPEVRFGVYKPEFSSADFYARNPDYVMISKRHYYLIEFPLSQLSRLQRAISVAAAAAASDAQSELWTNRRRLFSAMLSDPNFRRINGDDGAAAATICINFEVLELTEANLDVLPGGEDDSCSVMVAKGEDLTLAFCCTLYCLRGLRADIDLYNSSLDSADFSPEALADTSAAIVVRFIDRLLTSDCERLARMPDRSLSLFVSLDCLNRRAYGCPNCDLESRLAARLRCLISDDVTRRHPFYSEGCPYSLLKRRVPM